MISVGKLAEENDIKFSWDKRYGPTLAKPDGTVVKCQLGINVPIIAAAQSCPTIVKEKSLPGIANEATENSSTTTKFGGSSSSGGDESF